VEPEYLKEKILTILILTTRSKDPTECGEITSEETDDDE